MATPTYSDLAGNSQTTLEQIKQNTAIIASGMNPDGTPQTAGGPVTIADGSDVTQGAIADAAVITNTTGTVSGKLRGLIKLLIDLIAKTPSLGAAGVASDDVISVQGITNGTSLSVITPAGTTTIGKNEDDSHVTGDTGVPFWGVRNDGFAVWTSTNADYSPVSVNSQGQLQTTLQTGTAGVSNPVVVEDVAAPAGNAGIAIMAIRRNADGTNTSADGDWSETQTDSQGFLKVVNPSSTPVTDTAAANTAVVHNYAAVAAQRHRLTVLSGSLSAVPTACTLQITDGGTLIFDVDLVAAGPFSFHLPPNGIQGSVNSVMVITLSAAGVTVIGKLATAKHTA